MPGIREHPGNNNPFNIALMVFLKLFAKLLLPLSGVFVTPVTGAAEVLYAIKR
jgi:hypothetical protein